MKIKLKNDFLKVAGFNLRFFLEPKSYNLKTTQGFSLMETLTAIAIMTLIGAISFNSLQSFNKEEALGKEKASLVSLLAEARSLTLASKNASEYGVHLGATGVTVFAGTTYTEGHALNVFYPFAYSVQMNSANLSGGGSDIVFERLTGETLNFGSVILSLVSDPTASTTVTISQTGVVE